MTDLDRYLADNPALTARDYKGKGFTNFSPFDKHHVEPGEVPWDRLDRAEVRYIATSDKARFLPRNVRMAAAVDPGLLWDARTRSYRLADEATPAPPEACHDRVVGEGGRNVPALERTGPASTTNAITNRHIGECDNA